MRLRLTVAVVLLLVGLLWVGQGIGLVGGSAMTGSSLWAVIGAVLIAIAWVLAWTGFRSRTGTT